MSLLVVLLVSVLPLIVLGQNAVRKTEPHLVSYSVLEGVVEPFRDPSRVEGEAPPAWKVMKRSADLKAANHLLQQAITEYGQLIKHPYLFAEMPMGERYDVFISMSKLLKTMGHYQKAELLLYESLSYAQDPSEAHFQLALLFIDKEDLQQAKTHIKNCLFYKENDIQLLVHLTVVLICEGKIQEAKFYASRVLSVLENRVKKLSFLLGNPADIEESLSALTPELVQHQNFLQGIEDLISKVFHCEYQFVPNAAVDTFRLFSSLHGWIARGEMEGRFVFDLGQALYESGRPEIGLNMMRRGQLGAEEEEGLVSGEVVRLRMGLEFPLVPHSLLSLVEAYLNVSTFLSRTAEYYTLMPIENLQDVYWPLPLLQGSGLPVHPILKEVLGRFEPPITSSVESFVSYSGQLPPFSTGSRGKQMAPSLESSSRKRTVTGGTGNTAVVAPSPGKASGVNYLSWAYNLLSLHPPEDKAQTDSSHHIPHHTEIDDPAQIDEPDSSDRYAAQMLSAVSTDMGSNRQRKDVSNNPVIEVGILGGHMNSHPVGHTVLQRLTGLSRSRFKVTLLALPLINSAVTRQIVNKVSRVVNVPSSDVNSAFTYIAAMHFDIIMFPDWQPFPDQSSLVFQSLRIAPVQICFYVRGSSCGTMTMDYYIVPEETWGSREGPMSRVNYSSAADSNDNEAEKPVHFESWGEQVVRLDWPVFTVHSIRDTTLKAVGPLEQSHQSDDSTMGDHMSWEPNAKVDTLAAGIFTPTELEGKVFFDDQPVMLLVAHPQLIHPLMDDILLEILRSVPTLQLLIVIPESFFSHTQNLDSNDDSIGLANPLSRRRMSWAGKLVRRLWNNAGSPLNHRIRLLPEAFSMARLNQVIKNVDVVLDSFPFGLSLDSFSAALYYGTPIVTMRSGTKLSTPPERLKEIRRHLFLRRSRYEDSAFLSHLLESDIPWSLCSSAVAPALESLGLGSKLVANSTRDYTRIAVDLLKESGREAAYEVRVQLFDALDRLPVSAPCFSTSSFIPPEINTTNSAGENITLPGPCPAPFVGLGRPDRALNERYIRTFDGVMMSATKQGLFLSDLERFLWGVGSSWASGRILKQHIAMKQKLRPSKIGKGVK